MGKFRKFNLNGKFSKIRFEWKIFENLSFNGKFLKILHLMGILRKFDF